MDSRKSHMTNEVDWTLSGFGDEIDADPVVQVAVLQALGANHIDVRSAWGTNIVGLDTEQLDALAVLFNERGMGVSAIASPIGKVDVTLPVQHEVHRLEGAICAATRLDARYIRIFSFYREDGVGIASIRNEVLVRMRALADLATPLAHVHVKNVLWRPSDHAGFDGSVIWKEQWAPLRTGQADVEAYFVALTEHVYDGWVTVEDFLTELPLEQRTADNLAYPRATHERVGSRHAV